MKNLITNYWTSDGKPILERVDLYRYQELSERFRELYGVELPSQFKLHRMGLKSDELYVLHNDYEVRFQYRGENYRFKMLKGFIFDKASVPQFLRSIVDNDDPDVMISAMCHDAMFALHLVPFRRANKLFYWIIKTVMLTKVEQISDKRERRKLKRETRYKPKLYFLGVATPIGRKIYNSCNPFDHWLQNFVIFSKGN